MKKGAVCSWNFRGQGRFREDHGSGRLPVIMGFFYFICGEKGKKEGRQTGKQVVRQLVTAGILLILLGIPKWKRGQMELTMLDVGQGDCFFFRDGNGKNYLIDGGSSSVDAAGRYRLEPFLKFRGVKRLDYVWVTHGDVDHLNAVEELLERRKYGVEIQYLIFPEQIGRASCRERV